MAQINSNSNFPSQVVSDLEKMSYDYGMRVAKAIEHEWFHTKGTSRFGSNNNKFHKLRLYARGEQGIQKYKDELSINGDLSYLNLDWTPVPIIPKFVDIVVNGIAERLYEIKAFSQDPFGVEKRTSYMEGILKEMKTKEFLDFSKQNFGVDLRKNKKQDVPETPEEVSLHMQLNYKQAVEIAEEQAITTILNNSDYELVKKRFYYDIAVCGIGAVKTTFNTSEGVKVDYVDPANLVYSHTDSPHFDDIYYVGEVKTIPINELIKEFPHLDQEKLEEITKSNSKNRVGRYNTAAAANADDNTVQVLYFNYKTYSNETYKMKTTSSGGHKAIEKDDTFNPPEEKNGDYSKVSRSLECLYEGALVAGTDILLKWEMAKNMMRPKSDFTKVKMNYAIVAPRMYEGRIESLVSRITGFADMIQLTHLKLQQVMSRMVPDGIFLDVDGLAEVDLGNGTNYNPQEALNMFFQTGSIVGRSYTAEGDQNPGKIPVQELPNGAGGQKMQSLISTYNYYLQMIRDVTGLNEARDASTPDVKSLVGVQKMAAANSNTATRHILKGGMFLTKEVAEQIALRISDIIEYSPTKDAFIQQIGAHNVATLKEMSELHLYDFGIFLELEPDEEQKAMLENNIQSALQQQSIELEDAIDLRAIKNLKLANQMLKLKRKKKGEEDHKRSIEQTEAQGKSQAEASQAASASEVQKNTAMMDNSIKLENAKNVNKAQTLELEHRLAKELLDHEHNQKMELEGLKVNQAKSSDTMKEDRKDQRTKMQATQQSELIDQRNNQKPPKNFEESGNDITSSDFKVV